MGVVAGQADKPADADPKIVRIASKVSGHIHPALCISKGGTIVVIYSQADFKDLRLCRSTDGGRTWTVDFYNPGRPIGGRACPKMVPIDKDTLGTVFYDTDAKQPGGSGVFFLRTPLAKLQAKDK
jgi:hypothetical protein